MENELNKQLGIEGPIPSDYQIPYYVHQDDMNRLDQSHKRVEKWLAIICLVIFLAFVGTNAWWMWYENQFTDEVTVTQDLDASDGGDAIINDGVHIYGESKTDSNKEEG